MFISPAYAQFGGGSGGGSEMLMQLLPFVLIFVIMYMLILRPQQKRQKEHQERPRNIRRAHPFVPSGGLIGRVTKKVDDDATEIEIEIADGLRVRQSRSMIAD